LKKPETLATVHVPWSLDSARGIVMFSECMIRLIAPDGVLFNTTRNDVAQLALRASFQVKSDTTQQPIRFQVTRPAKAPPKQNNAGQAKSKTPVNRYVIRNEIQRKIRIYRNESGALDMDSVFDNLDESEDGLESSKIQTEIDRQFTAILAEYDTVVAPQHATYVGIKQISLDGAINTIIWQVDASGSTTAAYRNNDIHPVLMSYRERRFIERSKAVLQRPAINPAKMQNGPNPKTFWPKLGRA